MNFIRAFHIYNFTHAASAPAECFITDFGLPAIICLPQPSVFDVYHIVDERVHQLQCDISFKLRLYIVLQRVINERFIRFILYM